MIPIKQCNDKLSHVGHEWPDEGVTSWCDGVELPPVRDENNRKGHGTVTGRQDF